MIGEEVLDDIKDEDELQCDFEDLNEKPILKLNDVKVNLINEKTRFLTRNSGIHGPKSLSARTNKFISAKPAMFQTLAKQFIKIFLIK